MLDKLFGRKKETRNVGESLLPGDDQEMSGQARPLLPVMAPVMPIAPSKVDECADCPNCIIRKQVGALLERIGQNPAEDVSLILEASRITAQAQEAAREKNQAFSKDNREIIERLEAIKVARAAEIAAATKPAVAVHAAKVARGGGNVAPPRRRNQVEEKPGDWVTRYNNSQFARTDSDRSL